MPIKTIALSIALALAVLIIATPMGGVAQAAAGAEACMIRDGGSASFDMSQLPDPFERDFDGDCAWWKYELVGGRYVRTVHPCRFGDQEMDYSVNHRAIFQTSWDEEVMQEEEFVAVATEPAEVMAESAEETTIETAAESIDAAGEDATVEQDDAVTDGVKSVSMDIVQTAAEDNRFATLLAAAGATDVVETLRNGGPFTVFAPSDDAFATELPGGDLDEILIGASGQLAEIILYHLVPGLYTSQDLTDGMELMTLQGGVIVITIDGDTVMANDATVVMADVEATNGVIHVIDGVLRPETE